MRHLDPCPSCSAGTMQRYSTKTKGRYRKRYLACSHCNAHGQEVIPIDELGRPLFSTSFTPPGNNLLESDKSPRTIDKREQ